MDRADRLLELIQLVYAAPGTVEGWRAFLDGLRSELGGSASSLISQDLRSHHGSVAVAAHVDPEAVCLYERRWGANDPSAHSPTADLVARRSVIVGDVLTRHEDARRTAYDQDFARTSDIARSVACIVDAGPTSVSVLSIDACEKGGPFDERDVALLESLVPHVRRALQLHRRLATADRRADDLATVIDGSTRGVLLIDDQGRVAFMNAAASRLTAMRDGVTVDSGEFRATYPSNAARLRSIMVEAAKTSSGCGFGAAGLMAVARPSGRRPFQVLVSPVSRHRTFFPGARAAAAIVFLTDPEQDGVPDEGALQTLFGLTPAEAKLTSLLARGSSLNEAGAQLGLRRETVRSRLKTIFDKTNTHRQAELVRLVIRGTRRV